MKVYIGVPVYGQLDSEFSKCLSVTKAVFQELGHTVEIDYNNGCAIITKARNDIVARFMASGFDKLLCIDSDMVWDAVDAAKLIHSRFAFTGIAYRKRFEEIAFNVILNGKTDEEWLGADKTGTGFLCLHRGCLERMQASFPETKYFDDGERFALFDFKIENERYHGEDYTFCDRWKSLPGCEIWILPADIGHIGRKVFYGNIKGENNGTSQSDV
jgi:hypothetical protein